jgi:pimeloyl-ACP methyl ester carboxylesterase
MKWIGALLIVAIAVGAAAALFAKRDVDARKASLAAERRIAQTSHGPVEYISWGDGPPVLVIHGAGGGFDQGRLIARAFGGDGFRWVAPSRFGYLGSPLPADASTAAQADAFAELLDHLGVDRVSIVALSGGVPPALQFAERHPERTARLVLLSSAPFTPYAPDVQQRPLPDWLYQSLFGNDTIYWLLLKLNRGALEQAFDARAELRATMPREERAFLRELLDAFLPASARVAGVFNEGAAIDPSAWYALERITAPTLIVHARDDHINQFAIATALVERIPGASLMPLDTGGHALLGRHAEVRARVSAFLREEPAE